MELIKYPMKLSPVSKEVLWGGTRLKKYYNKTAPFPSIAESWELTVRPDGTNRIENGEYRGKLLSELVEKHGSSLLGSSLTGDDFPLLIKFIDAGEPLSVQVHPDDVYARARENESGKTEFWYVVEADAGAQLVYGLKEGVTAEAFAEAAACGNPDPMLCYADVKKGDTFFIPAGQIHAIGKGILIAEIQQNSNITYRVYDYNRPQADGSLRQLHTKKALEVLKIRTEEEIRNLRFSKGRDNPNILCHCSDFSVKKILCHGTTSISVSEKSFQALLVLESANGFLRFEGDSFPLNKGDCIFLPAGMGELSMDGEAEILAASL